MANGVKAKGRNEVDRPARRRSFHWDDVRTLVLIEHTMYTHTAYQVADPLVENESMSLQECRTISHLHNNHRPNSYRCLWKRDFSQSRSRNPFYSRNDPRRCPHELATPEKAS